MRICGFPKCGTLTRASYCDTHSARSSDTRKRESSSQRGYDVRWRKARAAYLAEHALCVDCASRGRTSAASNVDHVVPHKGDHILFWDESNWQALCASCHSRKTAIEDGRWGNAEALPVLPRSHALHVVCGPNVEWNYQHCVRQCATHVSTSVVISEAHLLPSPYEGSGPERNAARVTRNHLLRDACEAGRYDVAYLVVTAPKAYERAHWRGVAGCVVTFRTTTLDACVRMIETDSSGMKSARIECAREWFRTHTEDPFNDLVRPCA